MSYWYFPSNKDVFDLVRCLHERDVIDQPFQVRKHGSLVGDIVYVYVTAPYGQFMYKMEIIDEFSSFEQINKGGYAKYAKSLRTDAKRWARLKFIEHANPAHRPLQPALLRQNDINTSANIYLLSKEKALYLDAEFKASREEE